MPDLSEARIAAAAKALHGTWAWPDGGCVACRSSARVALAAADVVQASEAEQLREKNARQADRWDVQYEARRAAEREAEQLRTALRQARESLRLTRDYVGAELLPDAVGWSWSDAIVAIDAMLAGSESPTNPDATKANAIYVGLVTCALDSTPHVAGSDCQHPVPAVVDVEQKDATK